jgi:hypothetical protein
MAHSRDNTVRRPRQHAGMATVRPASNTRITRDKPAADLHAAVDAFLSQPDLSAQTRRSYRLTLVALAAAHELVALGELGQGDVAMSVSVFGYAGKVTVGFLADASLVPEPQQLTDGFRATCWRSPAQPRRRTRPVRVLMTSRCSESPVERASARPRRCGREMVGG